METTATLNSKAAREYTPRRSHRYKSQESDQMDTDKESGLKKRDRPTSGITPQKNKKAAVEGDFFNGILVLLDAMYETACKFKPWRILNVILE